MLPAHQTRQLPGAAAAAGRPAARGFEAAPEMRPPMREYVAGSRRHSATTSRPTCSAQPPDGRPGRRRMTRRRHRRWTRLSRSGYRARGGKKRSKRQPPPSPDRDVPIEGDKSERVRTALELESQADRASPLGTGGPVDRVRCYGGADRRQGCDGASSSRAGLPHWVIGPVLG